MLSHQVAAAVSICHSWKVEDILWITVDKKYTSYGGGSDCGKMSAQQVMVTSSFFIVGQLWIISFYFTGTTASINSKTLFNAVNNNRQNRHFKALK